MTMPAEPSGRRADDAVEDLADDVVDVDTSIVEAPVPLDAAFELPIEDALEQHQSVPDDDDAWEHE